MREYWLIDLWEPVAEFYRLRKTGVYELVFAGNTGMYRSEVIEGFALEVSWLWKVPLPRPELAVLEMAGPRYAQEVLVAAVGVLPAGELVRALPDVLATLPADVVAQVLPDVLAALPLDFLVDTLVTLGRSLPPSEREKLRDALS
ncbi:MAG: hypothetical protein ACE5LU_15910 [Anaerolineae bacterium]